MALSISICTFLPGLCRTGRPTRQPPGARIRAALQAAAALAAAALAGCSDHPSMVDAAVPADAPPLADAALRTLCPPTPAADHLEWCVALWDEVDVNFEPTSTQGFPVSDEVFVNALQLGPNGGLQIAGSIGGAIYTLPGAPCSDANGLAVELVLARHPADPAVPFELADSSGVFALQTSTRGGLWQVQNRTLGGLTGVTESEALSTAGPQYLALFFDIPSGKTLIAHDGGGAKTLLRDQAELYPPPQWRALDRFVLGHAGTEDLELGWMPWTTEIHYLAISCMPFPSQDDLVFVRSPL
jgi:hypothetical protein